ncbi:N-acetylmuramoyl-L-alanine amidase [Maribacter sp. MMG018]|uniref:peptidoglycan recognition protein family protein n=1 Tax=Maribacter sp. MMG018 TaxID=2822688 RepID=UPI001B36B96E|nr:peptidoglycan recognition family protein [Maribacter sp. MMG018]MBQ4915143.1 N-acetylmuramoyl-L-alanine amidase [Maribacter sp. MMG018]
MRIPITIALLLLLTACKTTNNIVDKPIIFNEERKILTLEYLSKRYGLEKDTPEIEPKMIVLHWTVIPTFEKSFEAFNNPSLPNWRPDIKDVSGLNVSSQFMVDRDGTIYRLMPETTMARHVIGLNHCAIGVENVGGDTGQPLTRAQLKSNIWLVRYLAEKYDIDYLIGHYEYTRFENHPLWLERDKGYRTKKTDPGEDFMRKIRKAVKDLNFKPLPE